MLDSRRVRAILDGTETGLLSLLLTTLLSPIGVTYGILMSVRSLAYRSGIFRSFRLSRPVISVGNITAGGTGKTPAVIWLARRLIGNGYRVCVLSRGYGGSVRGEAILSDGTKIFMSAEEAGDEPFLMAETVPGLAVVVGRDRSRSGKLAIDRIAPDVLILDDGFQHLRLRRDLDIVLLDSSRPFGNGKVLPAGLLREFRTGLTRSDVIIHTRCRSWQFQLPVNGFVSTCSMHRIGRFSRMNGESVPDDFFVGAPVLAVAGIADPSSFFRCLLDRHLKIAATVCLDDHAAYGEQEVRLLEEQLRKTGAAVVVTTGKDAVKLRTWQHRLPQIFIAELDLVLQDEEIIMSAVEGAIRGCS